MKRLGVLLMVCLMGTISSAAVLLNDTFADGSRVETSLPTESGFWASSPADVVTGVGSVAQTMGTSSRRLHTYFAADGSPVSLGVGEQLITTVEFSPEVSMSTANTSRNFRFGMFYDNLRMAQDSVGDSGVSNSWTDATGYNVQFSLSTTETSAASRVGKRTNLAGGYSLLGSDSAYTYASNGGLATNMTLDTVYTITMTLDYQAANQMVVSFAFADGANVLATASLIDDGTFGSQPIYTDFDFLQFRFSKADGTAGVVDFHSIKVEHVVPEPATMLLLGLGALMSLKKRRS